MRKGSFNGMGPRDWRIFSLSWFIGHGWLGVGLAKACNYKTKL